MTASSRGPHPLPTRSTPARATTSSATTTLAPDQLLLLLRLVWLVALLLPWLGNLLRALEVDVTLPLVVLVVGWWVAFVGGLIILGELLVAALRLARSHQQIVLAPRQYLRIRTPNPQFSAGTIGKNQPDGADLWYAAQRLFAESPQRAPAPWLAATLSAWPDEPVTFGMVVGGGAVGQHARWVAALRQIVIGHNAEAVVEPQDDPLDQAIQRAIGQPDAVLAWAEFLLPHSAAYPLRVPESADADLLGPLLAQLRPRAGAVRYAEAQVVTQPSTDWRSDGFGWRAAPHRRLSRLRARATHGFLGDESKALERKLNDPAASAVLRVVVVAVDRTAARQMLSEVGAVLGQYAERSGQLLQRFVPVLFGSGQSELSTPPTPLRRPTIRRAGLALGLGGLLALVALHWPIGVWPLLELPVWAITTLPSIFALLWLALPLLLALAQTRLSAQSHVTSWRMRLTARAPRLVPPLPLLLPLPAWWGPAILSVAELGGIWHLPSPNLGNLANWLPCRQLPAPPQAFISGPTIETPTRQTSRRIMIGHAVRSDGQLAPVGPSLYDLRNIGHLTAGMGAGKSRFFANFCKQVMAEGFTLIDGKGDDAGNLTATVRQYIARQDEPRVVLLDITDSDWPISLNPLAGISLDTPGAIDRVTAQVQSIFARLDPEGWTNAPGMQQFLDMGTRLVVETVPLPTVAHVKQALIDEGYRNQLLQRSTKLEVKTFWQVIYPTSSEQQKTSMNALMRRFDKLLLSDLVRALMTQERPTVRFGDAIAERLIVLCPIPHVTYGPLAATAAMLLFQSFMRAAFERPGSATTRPDYPLIMDEFQVLVEHGATEDVAVAVTQLRSLGIPTLYAHQAMSQVGDLRDILLINAESRILMRTQEPDAGMYARHYSASGLSGADIISQEPTEHQYARFVVGGHAVGPISIVPLPWPTPLTILDEPYKGPDWQTIRPADYPRALPGPVGGQAATMAADYDGELLRLIYHTPWSDERALLMAERLTEEEWYLMNSRWEAIARAQRQYVIDHPGCIPDRNQRVRWLSRLGYARPRLLAEVEFLRIRRAMGLGTLAAAQPARKDKRAKAAPTPGSPDLREHWTTDSNPRPPDLGDPSRVDPEVRG